MTTGKTLEEAKAKAAEAVKRELWTNETIAHTVVEIVVNAFKKDGFVLCNQQLTVDQRNKGADAFHSQFQSIQAVFDAIVKAIPK
jgi:hypothetical protein